MRMSMWVVLIGVLLAACVSVDREATPGLAESAPLVLEEDSATSSSAVSTTATIASTTTTTAPSTTTTAVPTFTLTGSVTTSGGLPLERASVRVGDAAFPVDEEGSFTVEDLPATVVTVSRPGWIDVSVEWVGSEDVDVMLEPRVVRGVRVSRYVSMSDEEFGALLELIEGTVVNTLVFDTKDETGTVLYDSQVPKAIELGAVEVVYDVEERLAAAKERGLYTITRVVTFEDQVWTAGDPDAKLAGIWADARNPANWEYPLALALEACGLGFDEIQFDYVRFPAGSTAAAAQQSNPSTQEQRVAAIEDFLTEARTRLHDAGCAISADIFGIVVSSPTDEGIGQRPEEVSAAVDAMSPMVYPSHYSPGWLGFSDPNDHPGPVTADALDDAAARMAAPALLRPWLQAFYYNGSQVQAGIAEAEARGHGWMLWNAPGNYRESWLPALPEPTLDGEESGGNDAEERVPDEAGGEAPPGDEPAEGESSGAGNPGDGGG
jgi:hypothetical protein